MKKAQKANLVPCASSGTTGIVRGAELAIKSNLKLTLPFAFLLQLARVPDFHRLLLNIRMHSHINDCRRRPFGLDEYHRILTHDGILSSTNRSRELRCDSDLSTLPNQLSA